MEPQNRLGIAQLTNLAINGVDLTPLRSHLLQKYIINHDDAGALMDLSVIEQIHGNKEQGLAWQEKAFETCNVFRTDRGQQGKKKLLVFALPNDIGSNTPIEFLTPSDEFDIITYYLNTKRQTPEMVDLPAHDVAFCAAPADAENATQFYDFVRDLTARSDSKVLNLHASSTQMKRETLRDRLPARDGLRVPATVQVARPGLEQEIDALGGYPVVIRPLGSHAGRGLEKLSSPADLATYLDAQDAQEFHISDFIDYASAEDGRFRKIRIVFIRGKAYPCHLAIAERWDVWYVNADMASSAEKRDEEARFMERFEQDFAMRHQKAFDALNEGIGLDYFGIDCGEDKDGNLIVFEADNSLIVHDLDCKTTFPYKGKHMAKIFSAFEGMLKDACDQTRPTPV